MGNRQAESEAFVIQFYRLAQGYNGPASSQSNFKDIIMLITFRTDAYADITMFGDVALGLLKLMGHSATVPGAILAADVPAALQRLQAGVTAAPQSGAAADDNADEPSVSLSHRALPLIKLLEAAVAAKSDVMWNQ